MMSDYAHYVAYRNATDEIRKRAEEVQRSHLRRRRRTGREALARRLHSIADRLER